MFEFTAKRQRAIASFFSLSLSLVLMVSCASPVSLSAILAQRKLIATGIELAWRMSNQTSTSVNASYQDLGGYLRNQNFSNNVIEKMEAQHLDLSTKYNKLTDALDQIETESDKLFSMLTTNADINTTPKFKAKMLDDISVNKKAFGERIAVAQGVSTKLKTSIQKYRDILGYLQNKAGTDALPEYLKEVDTFISKAGSLNQEVQTALSEGRQIIRPPAKVSPDRTF